MSTWTWTVGRRRFRSWVAEEERAYHLLIMWAPLTHREEAIYEMFEGLDPLTGKMPQPPATIAAAFHMTESAVNAIIRRTRHKVEEYYKGNGLPPIAKPTKKEPPCE